MIPKVINYIWLGSGEKSKLSNICINSWYEKAHGFEIIEWNENNLDLDQIAKIIFFLPNVGKENYGLLWQIIYG